MAIQAEQERLKAPKAKNVVKPSRSRGGERRDCEERGAQAASEGERPGFEDEVDHPRITARAALRLTDVVLP